MVLVELSCDNTASAISEALLSLRPPSSASPSEIGSELADQLFSEQFDTSAAFNGLVFAVSGGQRLSNGTLRDCLAELAVRAGAGPVFAALPNVPNGPLMLVRMLDNVSSLSQDRRSGVPAIAAALAAPALFYSRPEYLAATAAAVARISPRSLASAADMLITRGQLGQLGALAEAVSGAAPAVALGFCLALRAVTSADIANVLAPAAAAALSSVSTTPVSPAAAAAVADLAGRHARAQLLAQWASPSVAVLASAESHHALAVALLRVMQIPGTGEAAHEDVLDAAAVATGVSLRLAAATPAARSAAALLAEAANELVAGRPISVPEVPGLTIIAKLPQIWLQEQTSQPAKDHEAEAEPESPPPTAAAAAAAAATAADADAEPEPEPPVYAHDILAGLLPTADAPARAAALTGLQASLRSLTLASGALRRPLQEQAPRIAVALLGTPWTHEASTLAGRAEGAAVAGGLSALLGGDTTGDVAAAVAEIAVSPASGVAETQRACMHLTAALVERTAAAACPVAPVDEDVVPAPPSAATKRHTQLAAHALRVLTAPVALDSAEFAHVSPARAAFGAHPRALAAVCFCISSLGVQALKMPHIGGDAAAAAVVWLLHLLSVPSAGEVLGERGVAAAAAGAAANIATTATLPALVAAWGNVDPLLDLINRLRDLADAPALAQTDATTVRDAARALAYALQTHPEFVRRAAIELQTAEWGFEPVKRI